MARRVSTYTAYCQARFFSTLNAAPPCGSEIPLKASPSLLYQNLSYGDGKFVYVHKTEVDVLNVASKETSSFQAKEKAYQAKVCILNGTNVLVLATHGGAQFWDFAKEKNLYCVTHGGDEGVRFCACTLFLRTPFLQSCSD